MAVIAVVAAVDLASDDVFLTAAVIAPFIAALGASTAAVAVVAILATGVSVALGVPNDIFFDRDHVVRVLIVAVGGIVAVVVARVRERRELELAVVGPEAQRMRLALDAGEMGTWRWDLARGHVTWDARLEALFGLAPGAFNGSFDTYISMLHPDDRELALAAVQYGMQHGTPWQFEHRVVWPDGSVHWLEGRGEPVRNDSASIVGATGVTVNIDTRRSMELQRSALLDAERAAREAAERSTGTLGRLAVLTAALSAAATVDDVAATMVHHGRDALESDFGWFGLVDAATDSLVARAHEGYDPPMLASYDVIPLDASVPATAALHTGDAIFVSSPADRDAHFPQFDHRLTHAAFIVLPISI
ncbi:MAG TPA: PAS domain-containing protein, partial [Acidimicrobiia bacterium]|nr:PAS domain-containing protein [Acidimicrobiia bacterium]